MSSTTLNRFSVKEWEKEQEPFQMAPHVYYVGTKYVGSYLFDTDCGLVLLDQGFAETVYLLFESVRRLGFDPKNIKHILVSHGHFDHCGGTRLVKEYSNGKIYMSKEDYEMMRMHPTWVYFDYQNWIDFEPDCFYADDEVLDFGNIRIRTILTPGHTPGTTSFLFDDQDSKGKTYRCGIHGGVGINTLIPEFYDQTPGWPQSLPKLFIESMKRMLHVELDIPLPSHPMHIPILDKAGTYEEGPGNPFINPQGWKDMINLRIQQAKPLVRE